MVKYEKVIVSFWATTERGKRKKITFTARKPIKKGEKSATIKKGKKNARK